MSGECSLSFSGTDEFGLQTRQEHCPAGAAKNVGEQERVISMLAGGAMLAYGLSKGSLGGLLATVLGGGLLYRGWTGRCMAYEQLGINTAIKHQPGGVRAQHGAKIVRSIHVNRDRQELYQAWRKLENLPNIMTHLISVVELDDKRSHWTAQGPAGQTLEWDAEIINDRPGELIAWRSLPGSDVDTAGSVHFLTPAFDQGTEIRVSLKYDPPGGKLTDRISHLFGMGLEDALDRDLREFKARIEAGEVPVAQPQPTGESFS